MMETLAADKLLSNSLPLAERFFAGALTSRSLAHAYILKGKALDDIYNLALQVAQVLNCQNPPELTPGKALSELACGGCTQCRWAAKNAHPAVLTISRLTYQVSDKGLDLSPDDLERLAKKTGQPTQIKTEQVERLLSQLGLSSEYNRVIIFTDAEELPAGIPSRAVPPYEWKGLEANEEKSFHIRPLERRLFNAASANRFLKTLEEPSPRTLFFFLAETEEQLLDTIVSRCQVIPCQSERAEPDAIAEAHRVFLDGFFSRLGQPSDVYMLAGDFQGFFMEDQELKPDQALEVMQRYVRESFSSRLPDDEVFRQYKEIQEILQSAIAMLAAKTNENQVLLDTFLRLSNSCQTE